MKNKSRILSPLVILGILAGIRWFSQTREKSTSGMSPQRTETSPAGKTQSKDNLTEIEGIGPKSAQALHRAGIHTYSQLAEWDPNPLKEILKEAGLRSINPETWPEQAGLAAKGDWDKLYALRDELKGGRRV